jgi:AcrR family transcriptional regulator
MESKRTQAERSAATRAALVEAARPLFTERGYAGVGTDEIARAAGVTRGALYHQFAGKEELFAAVVEQVEQEVVARLAEGGGDPGADLRATLHADIDAWLRICAEPEVHRIILIDAPAALGWERWREIGLKYGLGLVEGLVQGLIDAGAVRPQPVRPLAHVLVAAMDEAALYAARAEDRETATAEARAALVQVIDGMLGAS